MTIEGLRASARISLEQNLDFMPLVTPKGFKPPLKFPRGELLCEKFDGSRVRSYSVQKILKWCDWFDSSTKGAD